MSPDVVRYIGGIAEPRSIRRRRPSDLALVAGVDTVALVVPLVGPAVPRLGHDQPKPVVQDVRRMDPEPSTPAGMAQAERQIGRITIGMRHGTQNKSLRSHCS